MKNFFRRLLLYMASFSFFLVFIRLYKTCAYTCKLSHRSETRMLCTWQVLDRSQCSINLCLKGCLLISARVSGSLCSPRMKNTISWSKTSEVTCRTTRWSRAVDVRIPNSELSVTHTQLVGKNNKNTAICVGGFCLFFKERGYSRLH